MQKICVLIINKKSKFSITFLFFLTNWILSHYFLLIFCFICIFFTLRFIMKQPLFGNPIEFPRKMEKLIQFTKFFRKNDAYYWNHWSMRSFAELFLFVSFILFMPELNSIYLVFKVFYHYYIKRCYVCFKRECYMKFLYYFIIS